MTTYLVVVLLLNTPRIIQTFYLTRETDDPSSDLRKIAIDKKSGDIFAGGKNALMRMNSNFEKMFSISVGPRKNSKNCPPSEIHTCANATLTDNVVEVLEYFPAINQTIMCGSVQYGNCSLLYKNNIKPLPDREPANYLGSKYGSIIVPFQKTTGWVYFTGTSWDGRTLKQNTHNEFSFKRFDDSVFSRETAYSELRLCVRERQQSNLKFIYGFQDENFVYSIYLKIRKEGGTEHFETKISRICKLDDYMGTFQERILKCNQHNIATAAYYSAKEHLYVAFGTGRGSLEAGPSSVVCRFRDIKEQFDDDFKSCYTYLTSSGYTPPRWKNCNNDRKYMCKRNKNFTLDNFCTKDRHLDGIENLEHWNPHRVSLIQTDNSKLFTSVYAQNLTGHSSEILWVGTSDGLLLKADSNSPKVYGRFDLTKNRSIKIEADVETDQSGSYAYFLYGNKVSKFPLYSCQFHTTCGACVKSNDSLVCGWCKDACLQEGECATTWYNTSCPPFIHKLSPESGPVEGGTVLYLTGENFGKPNISSSSVSIGTSKCEEIEWNDTNICCNLTSSENGPFTSQIIVEIHPQKSINGYEIKGKSEVGVFNFSFKVPVVTSMSPSFGPRRGNTIVTITGNNLDIGSNTFLSMCQVIRKSSSNLVCKINECLLVQSGRVGMKYTKQCPYCDDVIMEIDKFKTVINGTFCYKQNPHIERISRTSTTTSGGLKFKIKGRQFDSVHNYVFRSVINTTHNEDMNCTQTNGTELVCETPDLTNMSIEHSRLQVVVLLENDDFYWKLWTKDKPFYIRVHQDPEIEGLKEILHDTHLLELQGRNLEGLQTEDIRVTLDDIECPMVDVTPTSLKCDLTTAIDKYHILERGLALRTKITIGNLAISFGHVTIQHQAKLNLTGNKTIVPVTLISVLIVLMLICVICMHRKRVGPFKRRILRHETVIFHADSSVPQMSRRLMPDPEPESSTSARLNDYVGDFDGKMEQAFGGLYNDFKDTVAVLEKQNLLIDGDSLRFDRNCSNLGRGNFGCVYKAFLQRPGDTFELVVAVKTIIRSTDADINAFLNEALIMKDFNHPNVLTLIGITLDKGEFPMVILPFMQNGSLLSFIRNEDNMPTVKLLVTYGLHIARGMEYMAENKFVHRDLAARNCMMDSDFIVKVADFGLTRDVYSKEYYSSENKQRLPVKWMAPESLEQGKYSAKSDVWSFGILLWELMTRGAIPYPEVDNWDVCTYIKTGRRLPRPEYCPPHLYRLMRMCWQEDLAQRPTFSRLREEIERLIDIKNNSKLAGDTQVELERCTHYHYMDEMSLARQRSLSTKWSVSSEDAALL